MQILKKPTIKFKFAFEFSYNIEIINFCRALKEKVGRQNFNFYNGNWGFNSPGIINHIVKRFPQVKVNANMQEDIEKFELKEKEKEIQLKKAQELKSATKSNLYIPKIKGTLYPYQKIGVEFFINNDGKAILADTMGLGKTVQSLAYIVYTKMSKTLVICPASVKYSWESEILKWTILKSFIIDSKTKLTAEIIDEYDIFIINYDILKKFFTFLNILKWDCIIIDEFQYIKNSGAQRTKFAKALAHKSSSTLLLSGTPLLSRPVELYNGLNLMDPILWNDWYQFTKKYCGGQQGYFGWEYKGATNIDELQKKIQRYFLRRTKENVLKELPSKQFINIPIKLKNSLWKQYQLAEKSFVKYLIKVKKKKIASMQALKLMKLNELRQITSNGKIDTAKDIIQSIIDSGEKVIVYSVYNNPLEILKKDFEKISVLLTGKTNIKERKNIIDKFQNNKNIKIFFGGIKSAGVGITLTAASNVLFIDFSWVPADHAQAVDRCHRIGQMAENITIYQLFAKGTIDEFMVELLEKKQKIFDKLIDGKEISRQPKISFINDVLDKLKSREVQD